MYLFFDERDVSGFAASRTSVLEDVGAMPLSMADGETEGYLFSMSDSDFDYRRLIASHAHIEDQPGDRQALLDWNHQSNLLRSQHKLAILTTTTLEQLKPQSDSELTAPILVASDIQANPELQLQNPYSVFTRYPDLEQFCAESPDARRYLMPLPCMIGPLNPDLVVRFWVVNHKVLGYTWPNKIAANCQGHLKSTAQHLEKLGELVGSEFFVVDFLATQTGLIMIGLLPGSLSLSRHRRFYSLVVRKLAGQPVTTASEATENGPRWCIW